MSDTPRTEAEVARLKGPTDDIVTVDANFACQLERELNAANDRIKRMEAVTNDPHALWVNWLRGNVKLPVGIGDVRQYQDRIKRMEEAYSATEAVRTIRDCWCNHDPDTWTRCSTCCDKIKRYHAAKANLNRTEEAKEAKL